jgi:hypothetical protein
MKIAISNTKLDKNKRFTTKGVRIDSHNHEDNSCESRPLIEQKRDRLSYVTSRTHSPRLDYSHFIMAMKEMLLKRLEIGAGGAPAVLPHPIFVGTTSISFSIS